ncbi:MAG TPA: transcriptional coactivator p15/PC4 family protein [Gaiellaceae bacterium]|nr:transcriptional coactivator p15/PC4 family protein [Gaiellaceae bacterium]
MGCRGHRLAGITLFYRRQGELVPTKKGLTIRVEQLPQLRDAVEALIEEAEGQGAG